MAHYRIEAETFGLPSEGTLTCVILQELIRLAVGEMSGAQVASEGGRGFIQSSLCALRACTTLRMSHKQMTLLLQNYVRASLEPGLLRACVGFAVGHGGSDPVYATWLYDLALNAAPPVVDVVRTPSRIRRWRGGCCCT